MRLQVTDRGGGSGSRDTGYPDCFGQVPLEVWLDDRRIAAFTGRPYEAGELPELLDGRLADAACAFVRILVENVREIFEVHILRPEWLDQFGIEFPEGDERVGRTIGFELTREEFLSWSFDLQSNPDDRRG